MRGWCSACRGALDLIKQAVEESGYTQKVQFAIDVAASEFWVPDEEKYNLGFKQDAGAAESKDAGKKSGGKEAAAPPKSSREEMLEMYKSVVADYPVISLEDPFDQNDDDSHVELTAQDICQVCCVQPRPRSTHR